MSHHTWHNVTGSSRITTKHAFATISFIAETFIFLYVGMEALDIDQWKNSKASSTLFALVLIGRAAFVFPIANITNCIKTTESTKIEFQSQKCQFIIWWAGLMRGAVTISLSYNQFEKSMITSDQDSALMITSSYLVLWWVSYSVFGSITKPLIEAVQLRHSKPAISDSTDNPDDLRLQFLENCSPSKQSHNQPFHRRSSLSLLICHPSTTVHYFWRKFDDKFMRPVFGGRGFVPLVPGSPSGEAEETS